MYGKRRSTKNRKPHLTEYFIRREKLVQKVDHTEKKIVVLRAPSGCGKTAETTTAGGKSSIG